MLASLGHPCKFQRVSRLGSVTARHSSSGRQPNFASLNWGRHLYSAGRPSRWALAHILVVYGRVIAKNIISSGLGLETLSQCLCFETKIKQDLYWTRVLSRPETLVSRSQIWNSVKQTTMQDSATENSCWMKNTLQVMSALFIRWQKDIDSVQNAKCPLRTLSATFCQSLIV